MKRNSVGVLVGVALLVGGPIFSETIERVVAKVNGEIITLTELEREVGMALEQMGPAPTPEEEQRRYEELRHQVLDRMIDNELVMQLAAERGLRVPARFFEEWKKNIMEQSNIESEEELVRQVELQGGNMEQLRKQFEEGVLIQEIRRMEVDSKVSVSEPEIQEHYRNQIRDYTEPAKVRLSEIVVRFDSTNDAAQEAEARQLLSDIRQGADFAEVARMQSESGSREAGGDLGFFEAGELTESLAAAAFSLAPGEVSDVIRLENAFYIIRVEEKHEEKTKPLEEVRNEVADAIFNEKMNAQMEKYLKQLRERAIIEIKL